MPGESGLVCLSAVFALYYVMVCPLLLFVHASTCRGTANEMCRVGLCMVGIIFLGNFFWEIVARSLMWLFGWSNLNELIFVTGLLMMVVAPACIGGLSGGSARMRAVRLQRLFMALVGVGIIPFGWQALREAGSNWAVYALPLFAVTLSNLFSVLSLIAACMVRRVLVRRALRLGFARRLVSTQRRLVRFMPMLYAAAFFLIWAGCAVLLYGRS